MAMDRLISILAVLLREKQTTARDLAARFEVSVRTIRRDVDRLCRAGIPLYTARGAGGGIAIMEGYALDKTVITREDREAILAGLRSLDSVSGTGYYRQLMERLSPPGEESGDGCVVIDLASWYGPVLSPRLALLKDACTQRRVLSFAYCAPGGESRRTVEPCRLVFRWSSWYLWGWCREREDFRLFKLGRMLDLAVGEETFPHRHVPSPIAPLEEVFPHRLQAVIRFDAHARWRLVDEYGADSFTEEADGSLRFAFGFPGEEELLRWLMTFGEQAQLLEPAALRGRVRELAQKIAEKYDS